MRSGEAMAANWDDVSRRPVEAGSTPVAEPVGFEAFVASRSRSLLRTAYLLTADHGLAEDLLQTALAKAWRAWEHIDEPEANPRKILVNTYASWWRRLWNGEQPTSEPPEQARLDDSPALERTDLWAHTAEVARQDIQVRPYRGDGVSARCRAPAGEGGVDRWARAVPVGQLSDATGVTRAASLAAHPRPRRPDGCRLRMGHRLGGGPYARGSHGLRYQAAFGGGVLTDTDYDGSRSHLLAVQARGPADTGALVIAYYQRVD